MPAPQPQSAVLPPTGKFAFYLTLRVKRGTRLGVVRRACAELPALTRQVAAATGERKLFSAVGFGAAAWRRIFGSPPPPGLVPFRKIQDGPRVAPGTQVDLFLHIHSDRHDANFHLARRFLAACGDAVGVFEEMHGFRNLDRRDLTGFIDGTENPSGVKERTEAAIVGAEIPGFAGGSFVSTQRWVHDLPRFEARSVAAQERVIGRSKADSVEMDDAVKPPTAHIARVVIEENGKELQILRQSLPYATTAQQGIFFVAYGRTPANFRKMLTRMIRHDAHGHYDHLMDFTKPVSGCNFFVPSADLLRTLIQRKARPPRRA